MSEADLRLRKRKGFFGVAAGSGGGAANTERFANEARGSEGRISPRTVDALSGNGNGGGGGGNGGGAGTDGGGNGDGRGGGKGGDRRLGGMGLEAELSESTLSDKMKRFRISSTPGEIRLVKEVAALQQSQRSSFSEPCEIVQVSSSSVAISFSSPAGSAVFPSHFLVSVPRLYPHHAPSVSCTDTGLQQGIFLVPEGGGAGSGVGVGSVGGYGERLSLEVPDWSPIMGIPQVVQFLIAFRRRLFASIAHSPPMSN